LCKYPSFDERAVTFFVHPSSAGALLVHGLEREDERRAVLAGAHFMNQFRPKSFPTIFLLLQQNFIQKLQKNLPDNFD
jgi:hypothetical protein